MANDGCFGKAQLAQNASILICHSDLYFLGEKPLQQAVFTPPCFYSGVQSIVEARIRNRSFSNRSVLLQETTAYDYSCEKLQTQK